MASGRLATLAELRASLEVLRIARDQAQVDSKTNNVVTASAEMRHTLARIGELEGETNTDGLTDDEVSASLKVAKMAKALTVSEVVAALCRAVKALPAESVGPLRDTLAKIPKIKVES